jgi:ketosteroid isomerase-like protein
VSNVETIRAIYARWSDGDFTGGVDHLDPGIELVMGPAFPDAGTYSGLDGLRSYTRGFLEPWERITIEAEELIDAGDCVVAAVMQRGVGEGSGIETELAYFHVWTLRDGKVTRLDTVRDRAAALEAAER